MKAMMNFINILLILFVFSPLKAMSDCHQKDSVTDDCHQCHEEKSEKKEEHKSDCAMACCHMALGQIDIQNKIILIQPLIKEILMPSYNVGKVINIHTDVFRPPIA